MKTKSLQSIAAAAVFCLAVSTAHAQLVVTTPGTQTITFDTAISNVVVVATSGSNETFRYGVLAEPNSVQWTGGGYNILSSRAFTARQKDWNPGSPLALNSTTLFGNDYNNNGNTTDWSGATSTNRIGIGRGIDWAPLVNTGSTRGLILGNASAAPFGQSEFTLRIQNNSGSAQSSWGFTTNAWFADPDTQNAVFTLSYSTDGTNFTPLSTTTTSRTTTGTFNPLTLSDWSTQQTLGGNFSASVANGDYLYVRGLNFNNSSGSGATFVLDNLAVTLVPEPSTWALLVGSLTALLIFRRRRVTA